MGIMSELHWKIFSEPSPDSDCCSEEKDPEILFVEAQSEARRSEVKEKELLAKQKCVRAAEILRGKKSEGLV